jgi:hypothetical protein
MKNLGRRDVPIGMLVLVADTDINEGPQHRETGKRQGAISRRDILFYLTIHEAPPTFSAAETNSPCSCSLSD